MSLLASRREGGVDYISGDMAYEAFNSDYWTYNFTIVFPNLIIWLIIFPTLAFLPLRSVKIILIFIKILKITN